MALPCPYKTHPPYRQPDWGKTEPNDVEGHDVKAAEVLRLYEAGRRDFRGENLRGQRFCGKDLSGADFSGADIRGTNFRNATLIDANFAQVEAGLQVGWMIVLTILITLLSNVSGGTSALTEFLTSSLFQAPSAQQIAAGWTSLGISLASFITFIRWGLNATTVAAIAGAAILITILIVNLTPFYIVSEIDITVVSIIVGLTTAVVAFVASTIVTDSLIYSCAIVILGTVTGAFEFARSSDTASIKFSIINTVIVTLLAIYIGYYSSQSGSRNIWIFRASVAFISLRGTTFRSANLANTKFINSILESTDFRGATLTHTCFRDAQKLDRVRPGTTYLNTPKIQNLLRTGNGDNQNFDHLPNLSGINLNGVSMVNADLTGSNLIGSSFRGAHLTDASFTTANLNQANLQDADLTNAKLIQTQLDQADLTGATLTGATLEDWGITTRTQLRGIQCDYVFMRQPPPGHPNPNPRRKPDDWTKTFAEGEFVDFIAPMVETLDLYHNQTADPRAVALAFHELQQQNPDADIELVSMEKRGKNRDKVLLRAEVNLESDLSALNSQYFQRYDELRALPPQALHALLAEKDKEVQRLERMLNTAIERSPTVHVSQTQGNNIVSESKYNLSHAQFGGGFAETVQGDQTGGTINNYGASMDDIARLLAALKDQAQTFPAEHKADALDVIEDLETDIQKPEPDQGRIARRLKRLGAIAATVGTLTSGAVTFSGDLNQFAGNIAQLTETLGIPVEQVQPPATTP
ncbi:MAG: pentapeptide repeat-containing protein [Elainellaceae cyanobacterium]